MGRTVPQSEPLTPAQVKNSAGGYVFQVTPETALRRFLILGTEGGTFYASETKLTEQGMKLVERCATEMDPVVFCRLVFEAARTAPKRTYAIYAYAVGLTNANTKTLFSLHSPLSVCFTGTDLFELVSYIEAMRGWGAIPKRAIANVLQDMPVEKLGLWAVKYRDRHGWTWRDVLRITHPVSRKDPDSRRSALFDFMLGKDARTGILPVDGYMLAKTMAPANERGIVGLVEQYGLPWEALTDEQRTDAVWQACLPFIGNQAVLRNLASFTRRGIDTGEFRAAVVERLVKAQNLHPITLLNALKTYASGGRVGRSTGNSYQPNPIFIDTLERSLNAAFTAGVQPTGKSIYVGLDVSGSMTVPVAGSAVLSCREVGAALALAVARNEVDYQIMGFTATNGQSYASHRNTGMSDLGFTATSSFRTAMEKTAHLPFGGTDCSLPMLDAIKRKLYVDTFVVITDNETWAGGIHPVKALAEYRKTFGKPRAKLAVIALTPTRFSIADPSDPDMLDIAGFSSDLPKILEAFIKM
jgi:60 kDa SS-A/Ro ribonucleoprotein